MSRLALSEVATGRPQPSAMIELLKPITWFAPMWAFGCGVISSGVPTGEKWLVIVAGVALAGPLVCGTSQIANDWFDRHVDTINEPNRPIPSGRVPGLIPLYFAICWSGLSLLVAAFLGPWVFGATVFGLVLAWAYSAPPLRLKEEGWRGCAAVAICYEGLAWFTGAAVMVSALPDWRILVAAGLYSAGAHGIMTLNDFKAVEGDRCMGIRSLPVRLGVAKAAKVACLVMTLPQVLVVGLLWSWGQSLFAMWVLCLLVAQLALMLRLLKDPKAHAPWYNATGTTLYVIGMMVTAFALVPLVGGAP